VARYRGKVSRLYFRADAAFAMPGVYEYDISLHGSEKIGVTGTVNRLSAPAVVRSCRKTGEGVEHPQTSRHTEVPRNQSHEDHGTPEKAAALREAAHDPVFSDVPHRLVEIEEADRPGDQEQAGQLVDSDRCDGRFSWAARSFPKLENPHGRPASRFLLLVARPARHPRARATSDGPRRPPNDSWGLDRSLLNVFHPLERRHRPRGALQDAPAIWPRCRRSRSVQGQPPSLPKIRRVRAHIAKASADRRGIRSTMSRCAQSINLLLFLAISSTDMPVKVSRNSRADGFQ
jgi:hypothetical protein